MSRKRSIYEGNKKIMEDEATYEDKQTVAFINLIVEIIVDATFRELEAKEGDALVCPPPSPDEGEKR